MYRIVLFFILLPSLAGAFQLDWSGHYRARATYLHGDVTVEEFGRSGLLYGRQYAAFNSTARVSDGLSLQSNFLLSGFNFSTDNQVDKKDSSKHKHPHQVPFFNSSRGKSNVDSRALQDVRLLPAHFYATYSNEFFQVNVGRQPFDFGMGLTYSGGWDDPLLPFYDVRDAVAVKVQYESFYLKPYAIIHNKSEVSDIGAAFAVAGGYKTDNITAEILYKSKNYVVSEKQATQEAAPVVSPEATVPVGVENPVQDEVAFKSKPLVEESTLNVYGKYKEGPLTAAVEWGFMSNDVKRSAGFGSLSWKTDFYNTSFNVIGGYISDNYDLNLNLDYTLLFGSYFYPLNGRTSPSKSEENKQRSTGEFPMNCFVFIPYVSFDLTDNHNVILFHAWVSDKDTFNFKGHDVGIVAQHKIAEGFKWTNTAGALLKGASVSDFLLQTNIVVSF